MLYVSRKLPVLIEIIVTLDYKRIIIYSLAMILAIELIRLLYRKVIVSKDKLEGTAKFPRITLYIFIIYINVILRLTLFGRELGSKDHNISRFYFSIEEILSGHGVLNALMFFPMGFLIYFLLKNYNELERVVLAFLFSAVFTILIEMIQYITKTGRFEISDLVCNAVGGLIGAVVAWIFASCYVLLFDKNE